MSAAEFENMVSAYGDRIYGFIVYYLGNRQEADDVMQEVLIKFWKRRTEIDSERVMAWLMTVARNACIDEHRKRKSRLDYVLVDDNYTAAYSDNGHASTVAGIEGNLFMQDLMGEVEKLEDPYKSIVILREIQGLKYSEISDCLSLPLTSVKVYLHRARKMLRDRITQQQEFNHAG